MSSRRFLTQNQLVSWSDEGKVDVQGDHLVTPADRNGYRIREALRFTKVVSGQDTQGLLSKVKTMDQVAALGAEHYLDSVILGETAYEVQQGYVAEVGPAGPRAAHAAPQSAGGDAERLASFIMGKLGP